MRSEKLTGMTRSARAAYWKRRSSLVAAFLSVFGIVLLAKGQAFINPVPSIDGWNQLASWNSEHASSIGLMLTQHRYGQALIHLVFDQIGFRTIAVAHASVFLALVISSISAVIAAITLAPNSTSAFPITIGASLIAIHPNFSEIFTFSDVSLEVSISIAMAVISVFLAYKRDMQAKVLAILLICTAASIYQVSVNFAAVLLAMRGARDAIEGRSLRNSIHSGIAILTGVLLYVGTIIIVSFIIDIPQDQRGSILRSEQIFPRISEIMQGLKTAFYPHWVPEATSVLSLFVIVVGVVASIGRASGVVPVIVATGFASIALFSVVGVAGVGEVLWLVPRVLAAAGVFLAAWAMLGLDARSRYLSQATIIVCLTTLLGFVSINSQVFFDHRRVVQWDIALANRIVMRMEMLKEFPQLQTVVIVGGPGPHRLYVPTQVGDLNISATYPSWSQAPLIEQATGHRLRPPSVEDQIIAADYCSDVAVWPAPSSVTVIGETGAVCLGKN